jgi:chemotaxis protein MotB
MHRSRGPSHENHERWLVSYADFITLLFAFFVVMFASSQKDKNGAKAISDSVREAIEHGQFTSAVSTMLGRGRHQNSKPPTNAERVKISENMPPQIGNPTNPHPEDLAKSMQKLQKGLDAELKSGKVQLSLEARGLVISLREAAFFASGDEAVQPTSFGILEKIADVMRALPNSVRLEGHTDSIPIHNSRFRNNWELSTARSIAMLQLLHERYQVPTERMSVAGYAENAPSDTNETDEGRAHNRRVDVVLLSAEGQATEPGTKPSPMSH